MSMPLEYNFLGWNIFEFAELDSTMEYARRLLERRQIKTNMVIVAGEQTNGRGKYGRSWASPKGNLYSTVILQDKQSLEKIAQLTFVASLSIAKMLEAYGVPKPMIRLKWPNDVLLDGKKISGILLEVESDFNAGCSWVLIGIGLNLSSSPREGISYPVTSLREYRDQELGTKKILKDFLLILQDLLERWREGFESIRQEWITYSDRGQVIQIKHRVPEGEQTFFARFMDVTPEGYLRVETIDGCPLVLKTAEVFF